MTGPYGAVRQALDDVRDIYAEARTSKERGAMRRLSILRLTDACVEAGVRLGDHDLTTLVWLAGFEPQQPQAVAEIIRRAAKL
jgi:hypothetical protein